MCYNVKEKLIKSTSSGSDFPTPSAYEWELLQKVVKKNTEDILRIQKQINVILEVVNKRLV